MDQTSPQCQSFLADFGVVTGSKKAQVELQSALIEHFVVPVFIEGGTEQNVVLEEESVG